MRTTLLTAAFIILCVTTTNGNPDSRYYELGVKGYELVLDMRYDEADQIFEEMIRMEPKNAIAYLYKSQSFFHSWQYSYLTPDKKDLEQFKALLFKTKDIAVAMPEKDNLETQFIIGGAYGNIGLYYANTNGWVRAWWNGRKGIKYIKKIIEKDPEYAEAYFLLGMYNYYAATLPKVIKSLSFLLGSSEGSREDGIKQLIIASSKGDFKGDAKIFLADSVYFEEKNYNAASVLLEELTVEYPNNHYLRLILAVCYRNQNRFDLSIKVLKSSLKSETIKDFPYLYGVTYYALGRAYSGINEYEKAIQAQINSYKILKRVKGIIKDDYDVWSLYEIGNAYEMTGEIERAHIYYSEIKQNNKIAYKSAQARIKNPLTPARIKLIKGRNYMKYGKYSIAEPVLRDLIDSELKDPSSSTIKAEASLYLGELEYHLNKYQDSIRTLSKVFTFNKVAKEWINPWAHYWLARCYSEIGEAKKAEKEYDTAYKYDDNKIRSEIDKARSDMVLPVKNPDVNQAVKQ